MYDSYIRKFINRFGNIKNIDDIVAGIRDIYIIRDMGRVSYDFNELIH